jgi:hypothetical protein
VKPRIRVGLGKPAAAHGPRTGAGGAQAPKGAQRELRGIPKGSLSLKRYQKNAQKKRRRQDKTPRRRLILKCTYWRTIFLVLIDAFIVVDVIVDPFNRIRSY